MPTKELRRDRTERARGLILFFLYTARPRAIEAPTLLKLLDRRNYPMSRRALAEHLQFLCEESLLRLTKPGDHNAGTGPLGDPTRVYSDMLERYANDDLDEDPDQTISVRLSNRGVNFQEGNNQIEGVCRIE